MEKPPRAGGARSYYAFSPVLCAPTTRLAGAATAGALTPQNSPTPHTGLPRSSLHFLDLRRCRRNSERCGSARKACARGCCGHRVANGSPQRAGRTFRSPEWTTHRCGEGISCDGRTWGVLISFLSDSSISTNTQTARRRDTRQAWHLTADCPRGVLLTVPRVF